MARRSFTVGEEQNETWFKSAAYFLLAFYDVSAESVEVLAIVSKSEAAIWLEQFGKPE